MYTVIDEIHLEEYIILKLDKDIVEKKYTKYVIEGKEFDIVPIYDAKQCIAIKAKGSYVNKKVNVV